MSVEIKVPTLGESVTEATVGQWFKKVGDSVAADEPVVELETDKVTIEVPAPASGTLEAISAKEGETVNVGALIGAIANGAAAAAAKPAVAAPAQASPAALAGEETPSGIATFQRRLLEGPNPMGGVAVSETARPPGPRNCHQSSPRAVNAQREIAIDKRMRSRMTTKCYGTFARRR